MKTVSRNQIIRLSKLIAQTWETLGRPGFVADKTTVTSAKDSFRKSELFECTSNNAASFDDVLNSDFERVEAHFHKLAGNVAEELNSHIAQQQSARRRCMASMSKNFAAAAMATGDKKKWTMGYAVAISRAEYGKLPEDLEMGELKQLVITIAKRTRSAIKKAKAAPVAAAPVASSEDEAAFATADEEAANQPEEVYEPAM